MNETRSVAKDRIQNRAMDLCSLEKLMRKAMDLGDRASLEKEVPVGAILIDAEGTLIGEGFNRRETLHRITAHAEILALEDYSRRFKSWRLPPGSKLIATVEPCLMCAGALIGARVADIYYGCPDPKGAAIRLIQDHIESGRFDHRVRIIQGGILEDECALQMKNFFKARRAATAAITAADLQLRRTEA